MLEYDFIGNVRVRSDFRLFVVDGGHTWINYGVYSALNYAWILDPVYNVLIIFLLFFFWKRPHFGQPVCILLFFIHCLAINIYIFLHSISCEAVLISLRSL